MLEIGVLPQLLPFLLPESPAGFDFETFHQAKKIARLVEAFEQHMAMVGHDAVGGDDEVFCCGFGLDEVQEPATSSRSRERFATLKAA